MPSLDVWHMDSRRFGARVPRASPYTLARTREVYATYYDVKYPGHERRAGRPLRLSPTYARLARARRGVRREVGLGAGELVRAERRRAATSRCGRAAGPGRLWSPAIGAEHLACRETAALFDETSFAKIDVSGEGAAGFLERLCANSVARDVGRDHLHVDAEPPRRDRVRLHGHAARRGAVPDRHRHGVRPARPRVDPPARPGRASRSRTSPRATPASASGGRRAREILQPLTPTPLDFRYLRSRELAVGNVPVPGAPRHLRRRARLGALLPDRVRPRALGRDLGRRPRARPRRRRLPGDRLDAAREGLPGLGRRHHPRRHAVRGRPRVRREARQGRVHRPRSAARATRSGTPPLLPRARRPARRRARLGAGAGRRRRRRPRDERRLRLHGRALDRLRLPAGRRGDGRAGRSRSRSSASGSRGEVAAEPLFDPGGERIRS